MSVAVIQRRPCASVFVLLSCPGHLSQLTQQQQHRLTLGHFQVRRMLTADDIQDDFDWDSIV